MGPFSGDGKNDRKEYRVSSVSVDDYKTTVAKNKIRKMTSQFTPRCFERCYSGESFMNIQKSSTLYCIEDCAKKFASGYKFLEERYRAILLGKEGTEGMKKLLEPLGRKKTTKK